MNDFHNSRDSRPRPVYRDRRSQPGRPRTAPKKNLFANNCNGANNGSSPGWS